jgi:hypothetical protein
MGERQKIYGFDSAEGFDRMVRGVRDAERLARQALAGQNPPHAGPVTEVTVRVAGCPTSPGNPYKGRFVFRDTRSSASPKWIDAERCIIVGMNDEVLRYGGRYYGRVLGDDEATNLTIVGVAATDLLEDVGGDTSDFTGTCPDGVSAEFDLLVPNIGATYRDTFGVLIGDWGLVYGGSDTWTGGPWTLTYSGGIYTLTGEGKDGKAVKFTTSSFDCCTGGTFAFTLVGTTAPWDTSASELTLTGTNAPPCGNCDKVPPEDTDAPCSALAWLESANCLWFAVTKNGAGRCASVTGPQKIPLTSSDSGVTWKNDPSTKFHTSTGNWDIIRDWPDGSCCPRLRLVKDATTVTLKFQKCENGKETYSGGGSALCSDSADINPCADNTFLVQIYCAACPPPCDEVPNPDYSGAGWYVVLDPESGTRTCQHLTTDPMNCVTLLSGPWVDESTCDSHNTTDTNCCSGNPPPNDLYITFGGCLAFLGTVHVVKPSGSVWGKAAGQTFPGYTVGAIDLSCSGGVWNVTLSGVTDADFGNWGASINGTAFCPPGFFASGSGTVSNDTMGSTPANGCTGSFVVTETPP